MMLMNAVATVSRRVLSPKVFVAQALSLASNALLVPFLAFGLSIFFVNPVRAEGVPIFSSNKIVVMISVDGLAGFYLDDPKAEMPTIRALAAAGARAESMKPSAPTVTWPNHTT